MPPQVRVSLAGVTNSADGSLSDFDADYVLYETERSSERCRWEFEFPSHQGLHRVCVEATPNPDGTLQLRAFLEGRVEGPQWSNSSVPGLSALVELTFDTASGIKPSGDTDWPQTVSLTPLFTPLPQEGPFYISPEPTFAEMAMMGSSSSSGSCPGCRVFRSIVPGEDGTKTLVGERVVLVLLCTSGTLSNIKWIIPTNSFKNYTADAATAVLTRLQPSDLDGTIVTFYWADAGEKNVSLQFTHTLGGVATTCTKKITIQVSTPICATSTVLFGTTQFDVGKLFMGLFGGGIRLSNKVVVPPGFPEGYWHFVNLVVPGRPARSNGGNCRQHRYAGEWVLDRYYPYQPPPTDPYTSPGMWSTGVASTHDFVDEPQTPTPAAALNARRVDESLRTFVMFLSSKANSKWVPLCRIAWGWCGCATRGADWVMQSSGQTPPSIQTTSDHPTWEKNGFPYTDVAMVCPTPFCPAGFCS